MDNVILHYDRSPQYEWERLAKDAFHALEYRATLQALRAHLPRPCRLLDAGGGPGRYAIELCRQGHRVALLDRSPQCVKLAQSNFAEQPADVRAQLEAAAVGDIRDLSRFADATFDAVLCLGGPLSHLIQAQDRSRAMAELVRVARPGAPVFCSVMGYLAVLRTVLLRCQDDLAQPARESLWTDGDHVFTGGYCDTHFFRPEELQSLAEAAGLQTLELRACEGLSSNAAEPTNALAAKGGPAWDRWLTLQDALCHDPAVVATSEHFLYVGRKPPA